MSNKPNNPPFHPTNHYNAATGKLAGYTEGATMRDYFAAKAMQSLVTQLDYEFKLKQGMYTGMRGTKNSIDVIGVMAYRIADAMLTEREKQTQNA